MKILIYDLEIENAILGYGEKPVDGIKYCNGWTDWAGMGFSVAEVWNSEDKVSYTFLKDNLKNFQTMIDSADCVAGYNNQNFDANVLKAQGINIPEAKTYDLMLEALKGAGHTQTRVKGYKLDSFCEVNLNTHKTEDGSQAPIMWQRGEYGRVIQYCRFDTILTTELIKRVHTNHYLIDPVTRKNITIKTPMEVIAEKRKALGLAAFLG